MKTRILGALALAATLPFAACEDGTSGDLGSLSLLLTDEPGDFRQAVVNIERIELVPGEEGDEGGVTVLRDVPFTTDLLTLSNDVASLVEEFPVPSGSYAQIRFIVPEACIEVEGDSPDTGVVYATPGFDTCATESESQTVETGGSLQLPSFAQTGIKVNLPGGSITVAGDQTILLLDFDVAESFGQMAGASGMWVMTPVINATDVGFSSTITVTLSDGDDSGLGAVGSLDDFQARLDSETEPVAFTDDDQDGTWTATFFHLVPSATENVGPYQVSVELEDDVTAYPFTLDPPEPVTVDLGSGVNEVVDFTVTSAGS